MKQSLKPYLFWAPRIMCILLALFLGLFAFDVFEEGYGVWKTILALLIHLTPTWIVLLVLIISWRREWIGGTLFLALGIFYIAIIRDQPWIAYLVLSGGAFVIGALFLYNWFHRHELREQRPHIPEDENLNQS